MTSSATLLFNGIQAIYFALSLLVLVGNPSYAHLRHLPTQEIFPNPRIQPLISALQIREPGSVNHQLKIPKNC